MTISVVIIVIVLSVSLNYVLWRVRENEFNERHRLRASVENAQITFLTNENEQFRDQVRQLQLHNRAA